MKAEHNTDTTKQTTDVTERATDVTGQELGPNQQPLEGAEQQRKGLKLLIVGLDGATFRCLNPWMEAGWMPTLRALMESSRRGVLYSTVPPVTAPSWVSIFSGVNPGRHGIYNFVHFDAEGKALPHSSRDVRVERLWHRLNRAGLSTHVVDVPLTFPPEPVMGTMVSDLMVAGEQEARTWPPSLRSALTAEVGADFSWAIGDGLGVTPAYLEHLAQSIRHKMRLDQWLLLRHPVDCFITVFQHTDVLSHYFWHLWDPQHPAHDPALSRRLEPLLKQVLQTLDEAVRALLESAGPEATVAVVSDHGFGPVRQRVRLNDWLLREGYLEVSRRDRLKLALTRRGLHTAGLVATVRRVDRLGLLSRLKLKTARHLLSSLEAVGPSPERKRSRAWLAHGLSPGLNLSEQAQHDEALIERLMVQLRGLQTQEGQQVFERVCRREEVYHGEALREAPDVVLQLSEGLVLTPELTGGEWLECSRPGQISGFHRPEGVWSLRARGVTPGEGPALQVVDLVPSWMQSLGLRVPSELDGRCAEWLFPVSSEARETSEVPVQSTEGLPESAGASTRAYPGEAVFSAAEAEEIRRRLEALGYQ